MRRASTRRLRRLVLIGSLQFALAAAVAGPGIIAAAVNASADTIAIDAAACSPQTCQGGHGGGGAGGGGTGGGGTGGGGQGGPGPVIFSAYCKGQSAGGVVFPGQWDNCRLNVDEGTLRAGTAVTFSVFVNTTNGNGPFAPSCAGGLVDIVIATGFNSCTFSFPNGAGAGTIDAGSFGFRAPFASFQNAGVHFGATVQGTNAFAGVYVSGPGSYVSADPAPILTMNSLSMSEGQTFNSAIATFSDPELAMGDDGGVVCAGTCSPPTNYEWFATIDWGDGSPNALPATIAAYTISGSHVYTEEGTYTVTLTLHDSDTPYNFVAGTTVATVSDAPLAATGGHNGVSSTNNPIIASLNPVSNATIASFSDADPNGTASDYSANINWGDGTAAAPADAIMQNGGQFDISGSHTYAALGPYQVTVSVCDVGGSCAQTVSQVLVYGLSSGGNFVVGNVSAASGSAVSFWGSSWSSANSLSGGGAPADFKGFSDQPSNAGPACGAGWSTTPGNSAHPPDSIPTYMAAIVSSSITQDTGKISGNTSEVVVIKTDSGYGPDPGLAGTGSVVAVLCP